MILCRGHYPYVLYYWWCCCCCGWILRPGETMGHVHNIILNVAWGYMGRAFVSTGRTRRTTTDSNSDTDDRPPRPLFEATRAGWLTNYGIDRATRIDKELFWSYCIHIPTEDHHGAMMAKLKWIELFRSLGAFTENILCGIGCENPLFEIIVFIIWKKYPPIQF